MDFKNIDEIICDEAGWEFVKSFRDGFHFKLKNTDYFCDRVAADFIYSLMEKVQKPVDFDDYAENRNFWSSCGC